MNLESIIGGKDPAGHYGTEKVKQCIGIQFRALCRLLMDSNL